MNNFKDRLNNFFFLTDDEMSEAKETAGQKEQKQIVQQPAAASQNAVRNEVNKPMVENKILKKSGGENVVAINQKQAIQKPQISIVEPRLYSEVQEVADYVLGNQTVIVNFRRMEHEQATKMIDFLMGVTYAINGDIQRLDEEIFICTPQSVTLNGSELSEFTNSLL